MTTQEKRIKINDWIRQLKWDVSPNEAAPILDLRQGYGLNVAAKAGKLPDSVGIFHGANLRIRVTYLNRRVTEEEKALEQLALSKS